jgi:hypothetical protein
VATKSPAATRWITIATWRSLHCYLGAVILWVALLIPYMVHCGLVVQFWMSGIYSATSIWLVRAVIPALIVGALIAFVPKNGWKWMRLAFIALAVLYALIFSAGPKSWYDCSSSDTLHSSAA